MLLQKIINFVRCPARAQHGFARQLPKNIQSNMLQRKYITFGLSICLLCAAGMPLTTLTARSTPGTDATTGATTSAAAGNDAQTEELSEYFGKHLKGETAPFGTDRTLSHSKLNAVRKQVWNAWCAANNRLSEDKLGPLRPLTNDNPGYWKLPEELEPHATMPYYWGSKGERPEAGYPLFLYIHGSGPKEHEWSTGFKLCSSFDDAPSAYFIPQIPNEKDYYRWAIPSKQYAWEKLLRQAFVTGDINPDRIYFFGISEGGYGSQRMASFYADYLAAAGPMAGGEPLKNAPAENCGNIGFSLLTGAKDLGFYRNELTGYAIEAYDSLLKAHPDRFKHRIQLIPERGHGIDYSPTTPWLKQHVRNPYPKHVTWEDFDMYGRYRQGFYNIVVNKRDGNGARTYYEMDIEGSHIRLNISDVTYETTKKDPQWGIELRFKRTYTPAKHCDITLYLCDQLVDLRKKVTLTVNGKEVFSGRVKPNLRHMVNSCRTFFDPQRIYPAAIDVKF